MAKPFLTQERWRIAGGICLGGAALMAVLGVKVSALRYLFTESVPLFVLYWAGFLVLLFLSLFIALLDFRYIRLQYTVAKRDLFKQTLGDEALREALNKALAEKQDSPDDTP